MIIDHEEKHGAGTFYIMNDGYRRAEMRYLIRNGVMNIYHTEVSPRLAGHNVGKRLVEAGVNYAREQNIKILPTCPFARATFARTSDWSDVLVNETQE